LNTFGSKIYRTDKDGGIVIKSDGEKIELTPRPPLFF
jgi:beta-lactamase superfamily II metal-dependent hydrolase